MSVSLGWVGIYTPSMEVDKVKAQGVYVDVCVHAHACVCACAL